MARIRTIKPEFCSSADTGALSRDARLFFLQLLTEADDEGRLLWIPRKLCGVLYPHDEDVTRELLVAWAQQCAARRMLTIYEVDGTDYVQVTAWSKHQKVSHPSKSRLPAPDAPGARLLSGAHPDLFGETRKPTRAHPEGGGNSSGAPPEGIGKAPDGLRPDLGTGNREGEQGEKPSSSAKPPTGPGGEVVHLDSRAKAERLAAVTKDAIEAFNHILAKPAGLLPHVNAEVGREKRQKQVGRCLAVVRDICQSLWGSTVIRPEFWAEYFTACHQDPFKSGRQPPGKGHENWTPSFEYLTRAEVVLEVFDRASSQEGTGT